MPVKTKHGRQRFPILATHLFWLKGRDECGNAGCVLRLAIPGATLLFPGFFCGVKKAVNRVRQGAIEGAQRCKRYVDKPMLASSFHQLSNAAAMIDSHDDEQAGSVGHLDNFTR